MGPLSATTVPEADQESDYPFLVDFDGPDDQDNPLNWSFTWKVWVTLIVSVLNLIGTVASSIFGTGSDQFVQTFNISHEIAVLGTTLFLAVGLHTRLHVLFRLLEDRVS